MYDNTIVPQPVFINLDFLFLAINRPFNAVFNALLSVHFLDTLNLAATLLVILLIAGIFFLLVRLYEIQEEDAQKKANAELQSVAEFANKQNSAAAKKHAMNNPWPSIRERLLGDNSDEWRLAIIEADIFMDRSMDNLGYRGETVSDKLKQLTPTQLPSIQQAWDAHKVRNRIAHDGADFSMTSHEARQTMKEYQEVLRDLGVIE